MAIPTSNSLSAYLMETLVPWRNDGLTMTRQVIAELGFAVISVIATVETIASLFFTALTVPLSIIDQRPLNYSATWGRSATFATIWASTNLICNMLFPRLGPTTEGAYSWACTTIRQYSPIRIA